MNPELCPDGAILRQLLLGQLSGIEADQLEQHLLVCSRCACLAEEDGNEDVLVQALRAQADRPAIPDDDEVKHLIDRLGRRPEDASLEADVPTVVENLGPASGSPLAASGSRPPHFPGYEVLRELGSGGMGIIYLALQVRLNRLVALKTIRSGPNAEPELLQRFQTEGEAVARLHHPHIVQIHEVGQVEGMPFFCLEYCSGGSLADRLREGPLLPNQAVQVLVQIADAVHAAHVAGVIHRDLKPANILLVGQAFQPDESNPVRLESLTYSAKVTDFGLAKRLDNPEGQTQTGQLLGTPSYMAPEQAAGQIQAIGPRTDVYALGAILYELLTGRPPFRAATVLETLKLVKETDPVPLRQLQPRCPRDLQTISLKCLEKELARRYGSARELAEDLQRYLAGEPIRARPVGWLGRTAKWVKRKPALAALAAVYLLAGIALLGLGFWFSAKMGAAGVALQAREERARDAEQLAQTQEFFALVRGAEKGSARPEPGWTWANVEDLTRAATLPLAGEHLAELRSEAATALGSIDVRPIGTIGEDFQAACLAFHPGGNLLALGPWRTSPPQDGVVRLIDLRQRDRERHLLFRPAQVLDPAHVPPQDGIVALAFSPDGRFLVAGAWSGFFHVWDLTQEHPVPLSWQGHKYGILFLCFNPDGTALFSASVDRTVKRWSCQGWDAPATRPQWDRTWQAEQDIWDLACHPREGWLLCFHSNVLDLLSGDTLEPIRNSQQLPGVGYQFSQEGNTLVRVHTQGIDLMNSWGESVLRTLALSSGEKNPGGHANVVNCSPDGTLLAVVANPLKNIKLWELASGRQLAHLVTEDGPTRAAFSPDGRLLAVTGQNQTRLYEIAGLREQTFVASQAAQILTCALHPDGHSLACQSLHILRPEKVRNLSVWPLFPGPAHRPAARYHWPRAASEVSAQCRFHPLTQALVSIVEGDLLFHDPTRGTTLLSGEDRSEAGLSFGADGRLWWAMRDAVRVWDVAAGKQVFGWDTGLRGRLSGLSNMCSVAAGRHWAVAGGRNGQVQLFHASNPGRVTGQPVCQGPVRAVALNADESLLAAGSDLGELRVARVPGFEVTTDGMPHQDRVVALSWCGDLLASGSRDRTIKLWHCTAGQLRELLTLRQPGPVRWLAFHPDGVRLFVLLDGEGAVRVWHLDRLFDRFRAMGLGATLEPITPVPLPPTAAGPRPEPIIEVPLSSNGLKAELFADLDFQRCVKVRYDAQVNWNWGQEAPDPLLPADFFSIRWTGWLKAPRPGRYTLKLESDDGSRLWLDGRGLMDWREAGMHQVEVELTGKPQALRIEMSEETLLASIKFSWAQQGGFAMQPVPTQCLFHDRAAAEKAGAPAAPIRGKEAPGPKP